MNDLLQQAAHSIRARTLLRRGQSVLVAVSGGVDSMVLLELLHQLSHKDKWRLTVAHLNHQLRGRGSDADERLVKRTANKLGLPFVRGHADIRQWVRTRKLSIEMAARQARHDFLARAAAQRNIPTIALAHHVDDQLELFFLRLFRGSGGEGLAGMKWSNVSPSDSKLTLVRPLLATNKADLKSYARENQIRYREDASNRQVNIQRNRIRHELLPLLRRYYQPALDRTILRVMEIARADTEFVNQVAVEWFKAKKPGPFETLAPAVQRRCVQIQLLQQNLTADYELVERLRTQPGRSVTLSPKLAAVLTARGELRLHSSRPAGPILASTSTKVDLSEPAGVVHFGNLKIQWRIQRRKASRLHACRAGCEFFDADRVGPKLIFRHWLPGDRFHPIGMPGRVKLQDLFANQKIPRSQRHELLVVTNGAQEVVWVEKLRISERFKLSKETKRTLQWRWKRL